MIMSGAEDQYSLPFQPPESFVGILVSDVIAVKSRQSEADTQQSRRELIRTVFAAVEGLVWVYRGHIVTAAQHIDALNPEEEIVLSETSYQITEQGKVVAQPRFTSLPAMIRLITRLANRVSPEFDVAFDTSDWEGFRRAIAIRNRVTHPKSESDLRIGDADIAVSLDAFY